MAFAVHMYIQKTFQPSSFLSANLVAVITEVIGQEFIINYFSDANMTEAEVVVDKLKESGIWIESPTLLEVSVFHIFIKINAYFVCL